MCSLVLRRCVLRLSDTPVELTAFVQDPCFEVRFAFVDQLTARIRSSTIKSARFTRFNMIFFLVAHDPETEIIEKARPADCLRQSR